MNYHLNKHEILMHIKDIAYCQVGCIFLEDSEDVDLESFKTFVLDSSRRGVQVFAEEQLYHI